MNKYQKIAVQMAKDDIKKGIPFKFKTLKNRYYRQIKRNKYSIFIALEYKNWNKM